MTDNIKTEEELLAEQKNIEQMFMPNAMSLEDRMRQTYKGELVEINPYKTNPTIATFGEMAKLVNEETTEAEHNSLLRWGAAASIEANKAIEGGMSWLTRQLAFEDQPNYNAFKDPTLVAEGQEFIARNAKAFLESGSPEYTAGKIKALKSRELELKALSEGGEAALYGQMVGAVFDPLNFLPVIAAKNAMSAGGILKNVASGALQTGAVVGATEVLRQEADPTITGSESLTTTLSSMALGGILFGVAGGLGKSDALKVRDGFTKLMDDNIPTNPLKDSSDLVADVSRIVQENPQVVDDLELLGKENLGVAKTNWLFNTVQKGMAYIIPEQRLLNSESGIVRAMINRIAPHNTITAGNLKGVANLSTATNNIDVRMANLRTNLDNAIEKAHIIHKQNGGNLTRQQLLIEGRNRLITESASEVAGGDAMVSALRGYFQEFVPIVKRSGKMPEDWVPKQNYFHYQWSYSKLIENQADALQDITQELAKQRVLEGGSILDMGDMAGDAKAILDDMIRKSKGEFSVDSFEASGLKKRVLNFSPEFALKYLSDSEAYGSIIRYSKEVISEDELRTLFGRQGNIYSNADNLIKGDYDKLRQVAIDAGDNERLKTLLDLEASDRKDIKDLIDQLTGRAGMDSSRTVRTISNLAKGYSYLKNMGKVVVSQIPDLARILGVKVFKSSFGKEFSDTLGSVVNTFKLSNDKDGARRLGIIAEEFLSTNGEISRASAMGDLSEPAVMTRMEKGMNVATNAFSKLTLMDAMNNTTRTWAAEEVAKQVLIGSSKLVKGTLKDGSFEAIELAKWGVTKADAQAFVKQFETHKLIERKWGGDVVFSNYEAWDPEIQLKFASLLRRQVDNTIIQKTLGSYGAAFTHPVWSVALQFKGFMIASQSKVVLPTLQKLSGLGSDASMQAGMNVMKVVTADLMLASLSGTLNDFVSGREVDLSPERLALHAFDRSAIMTGLAYPSAVADKFGIGIGALLGDESSKFKHVNVLEALLGPTAGAIQGATETAMNFTDGKITEKDMEKLVRLLPMQNMLWWGWAVNNISE